MAAISGGLYKYSQKDLSFIQKSNNSKNPKDSMALYLLGSYDKIGEMNLGRNGHILRLKQIAKSYYLSIEVMKDGDIGAAVKRTRKKFPDRPIRLLVAHAHGGLSAIGFTSNEDEHYTIEKVQEKDYEDLASDCIVCLSNCNCYSSDKPSIAGKIAEVSRRVVFASKSFLQLNAFFYIPESKNRRIEWVAFDRTFTNAISVKLRYDAAQHGVVEEAPKEDVLEEVMSNTLNAAKGGSVRHQLLYAFIFLAKGEYPTALEFYTKALEKDKAAAEKGINNVKAAIKRSENLIVPMNFFS